MVELNVNSLIDDSKDKDTDRILIYPNPLTDDILNIQFSLQQPQKVVVEILNEQGNTIGNLYGSRHEAGVQELQWKKGNQPAGIYTIKITKGEEVFTRKVVIQ